MKTFNMPAVEVVKFSVEDVITASGTPEETYEAVFGMGNCPQ